MPHISIDIREFAERVERLCDFFLDKATEDSPDLTVIRDLKNDAADLQFAQDPKGLTLLRGLDNYMRGHPEKSKEQ